MKVGSVSDGLYGLQPYVKLVMQGPFGAQTVVSTLVDTGSNGFVSLPPETVDKLALLPVGIDVVELANARSENVRIFGGAVTLGGRTFRVPVHQIGEEPTIGTALLRSHNLSVDFVPGGDLQVRSIGR